MRFIIINHGDASVGINSFEVEISFKGSGIDLADYLSFEDDCHDATIESLAKDYHEMFADSTKCSVYFDRFDTNNQSKWWKLID